MLFITPHFIGKETEAQRGHTLPQGHTAREWQSWDMSPSVFDSSDYTNNHYPCWSKILETINHLKIGRIVQQTTVWQYILWSLGRQCLRDWSWMSKGLVRRQEDLSREKGMMHLSRLASGWQQRPSGNNFQGLHSGGVRRKGWGIGRLNLKVKLRKHSHLPLQQKE